MLEATTAKIIAPWKTYHMAISDQIIGVESGGSPTAQNPNSSAYGPGQFITSTWNALLSQHRPDLVQGKTPEEIAALRSDPQLSREMVDAYAADNNAILSKNGLPVTPGNTYLAHFAGPQGAVSVLQADANRPVGEVLGPAVVKANPFLANMTVSDLRAWADRKMGGASPAPVSPARAPSAPLQLAPAMPAKPYFPPQAQPQAAEAQPAPQVTPFQVRPAEIQYAQRRPVDLSRLRAQLAAPYFTG